MKSTKLFLFLFLIGFNVAFASDPVTVNQSDQVFIGKHIEFFVDTTNSLNAEDVKNKEFTRVTDEIMNLGNIPHTVWLRFSLNSKTENELLLEIAAPLIETLEVYNYSGDSPEQLFRGGFLEPFSNRPIALENWLFSIPVKSQDTATTIYLKGRSGFPFQIPISVSSRDKYIEANQMHNLFWGLYMGVMIFAFLYNLFIFFSVRERTYFYYILYILGSVTFYLGLQGFTFKFLWPSVPSMNPMLPIWICTTNIIITLFALKFLQITKKQKLAYYWGWSIITGFGLIILLNLFGPYAAAAGLAQLLSMITAIYYIYAGIFSWKRKIPTAKYFLLAWTIFLVFVFIFLLTINNVLPSNFFTTKCIFIGHMTEVLLLSFALADRINWLKIENEQKQLEIIHQLEENERIQLKANRELEQKVVERTAEVVEQKNEAVKQRERSDELLLNILPAETAEELKSTGVAKAKLMNNVTVMFTDFKDFTKIAEKMGPAELVSEINECFSEFDRIISKYNVEKIKTIGDAYMAVGGLPTPNETHATDVLNAALEIQAFMKNLDKNKKQMGKSGFQIRIGLHTGPVVAGVVGVKKFAYDVWGNTVNVASRMENAGEADKINISESTYELVKDKFRCEPRGKVEAKNIDPINMYFVTGTV